jgi:hypothetical protein
MNPEGTKDDKGRLHFGPSMCKAARPEAKARVHVHDFDRCTLQAGHGGDHAISGGISGGCLIYASEEEQRACMRANVIHEWPREVPIVKIAPPEPARSTSQVIDATTGEEILPKPATARICAKRSELRGGGLRYVSEERCTRETGHEGACHLVVGSVTYKDPDVREREEHLAAKTADIESLHRNLADERETTSRLRTLNAHQRRMLDEAREALRDD